MPGRSAVSPVVAVVILVAIAITLSTAVAAWIMGLYVSYTRLSMSFMGTTVLQTPSKKAYYPFPNYLTLEVWAEPDPNSIGNYRIYYKLTFLKKGYVRVKVQLVDNGGECPEWVGEEYCTVEESWNVDPGDYVTNYWTPVRPDEFPLTVRLYFEYAET